MREVSRETVEANVRAIYRDYGYLTVNATTLAKLVADIQAGALTYDALRAVLAKARGPVAAAASPPPPPPPSAPPATPIAAPKAAVPAPKAVVLNARPWPWDGYLHPWGGLLLFGAVVVAWWFLGRKRR